MTGGKGKKIKNIYLQVIAIIQARNVTAWATVVGGDDEMIGSTQVLNILSRYRLAVRLFMREKDIKSDLTDVFDLSNTPKRNFLQHV